MTENQTVDRFLHDGFAAHRAGRIAEAEAAYRAVLEHQPFHFDARHLLGVILRTEKRLSEAAAQIFLALAINPASADAYNNLANIQTDLRDDNVARAVLQRALRLRPVFFPALLSTAQLALRASNTAEAIDYFTQAAAAAPSLAWHLSCRGQAIRAEGDPAKAATVFAQAATADPALPEAHANWAEALEANLHLSEALAIYQQGLQRDPSSGPCLEGAGRVLRRTFKPDRAARALKTALCLKPASRGAALHLAAALFDLRHLDEAKRWFSIARTLDPADETALLGCFNAALYACDWTGWESLREEALSRMRTGSSLFQPFSLLATSGNPADQLLAGKAYSAHVYSQPPEPLRQRKKPYRHDRVRIGYLSADLRTHAIGYLIAELIEVHDRDRFEIIAFSYGPDDESPMRHRLIEAFDQFHDIQFKSDHEAAELILQAEIDILIDLQGYTQHARPGILAYRPAPAQVNYLGFPGTLGSPFHDYVIADAVVIPPEDERWYTETVIRLPRAYQVNDAKRAPAPTVPTRLAEGLPEEGFVFCCFNNNWKVGREVFEVWMGLLRDIPTSILWLIKDNETAAATLRSEAEKRGIAPARLIFAPRVALADHLARHRLADLFLDTLPYCAHTTASDALFAGLPVLTCRGKTFAGRVATSLLTAIGVPELIVENLGDYDTAARLLATTPTRLAEIRAKIMTAPGRETLFDARVFARGYEEALLTLR